jgi:hypothetical protein
VTIRAGGDYLHACASRHRELTEKLSGRPQDLDAIERAVAGVRSKRALTYSAVQAIVESPNFAAGKSFWAWPAREDIERDLKGKDIDLWNLPKNEKPQLKQLRGVFKTFEAVSVILRFLVPAHYGILSTPVEHLLGIQPSAESIDRYLNYVRDLRAIRDKRAFKTAAQVDQALWTLQLGVLGGRLDEVETIKAEHARDTFLRSIRVKNLADGLFEPMSKLDLAEALSFHRLEIASLLLALEFERAVRQYAGKSVSSEDLNAVIDREAPGHLRGLWQRCRALRNRAVHGRALDHKEVEDLIHTTRQIIDLTKVKGVRIS